MLCCELLDILVDGLDSLTSIFSTF